MIGQKIDNERWFISGRWTGKTKAMKTLLEEYKKRGIKVTILDTKEIQGNDREKKARWK